MTNKEKEHYENLANYYNSKKEPSKTEMMKFKCIVEYKYPIEHKPPVKADIYLHGDKVSTRKITPINKGRWERKEEQFYGDNYYVCSKCGESYDIGGANINDFKYCPNCGAKMEIQE